MNKTERSKQIALSDFLLTSFRGKSYKRRKALRNYAPNNNRSEYRKTQHNRLIIDAYNANLSSMHAALHSFAQTEDAHKMMILGDMRELGTASADAHAEVLRYSERLLLGA